MMLVRIIKSWSKPDLLQHSPGGRGIWNGIQFTLDPVPECDYVIVLNHLQEPVTVNVPPGKVWCLVQEPPVPLYRWLQLGFASFDRVYTQDPALGGGKYIHSHGSLPWHVDRTYDWLKASPIPQKTKPLSWVTSNARNKPGHALRMGFLDTVRAAVPFDLFGRGFRPVADKWDALADYRYSIAFENYSGRDYFTEKITDCFLAGAMPLYYGATNLEAYFPPESFIRIDPTDPATPRRIQEIISSDLAEKNRVAILEARRRVLEEHQIFPRISSLILLDQERRESGPPWPRILPSNPSLSGQYLEASAGRRLWINLKVRLRLLKSQENTKRKP
jgi:hypothetical protein